jgi:ubiquitin thioesterase OTU1
MKIQVRLRAPNGQARLEIDDESTLGELIGLIKSKTELTDFTLKYGYPLKNLDISLDAQEVAVKELNLRGETIVVAPIEPPRTEAIEQASVAKPEKKPFIPKGIEPDETSLEWPSRGGYIGTYYPTFHPTFCRGN